MLADAAAWQDEIASKGLPNRYYHCVGDGQWEYAAWLSQQAGSNSAGLPAWRQKLYSAAEQDRREHAEAYRDMPIDPVALQQAEQAAAAFVQQQQQHAGPALVAAA